MADNPSVPGTPGDPGQPGSVPPARKTGASANLSSGLSDLAKVMADSPKAMEQLNESLAKMKEPIRANTEAQKEYTKSVKDAVEMMEDMLGNIKDIKTESGKLKLFKTKDLDDAKKVSETLEKIQAGYTALKKAGPLMDRGQTRWLKDDMTKIAAAMKDMTKSMDPRKMADFSKHMHTIAADAQKAAKAFEKIDFTKQVAAAKAVGGSFKGLAADLGAVTKNMQGMLGTMTRMQAQLRRGVGIPAVGASPASRAPSAPVPPPPSPRRPVYSRYMESGGISRSLGAGISSFATTINPRGQRITPGILNMGAGADRAAHNRLQSLQNTRGFEDVKGLGGMGGSKFERNAAFRGLTNKYPGSDPRNMDMLAQHVSGGSGGMGGMLDRFIAKKVLAAGGEGIMGGIGGKLMGMGGGSAMGGLSSLMGKFAGPLSIITSILEVLQAGADRNKDTFGALGQGGMVLGSETPGDLKDTYNSWTTALKPGNPHSAAMYGVDFESNASIMKQIVNAGIGVGGMQKGHATGALGAIEGGRATDEFSGVMRNAYMLSGPLGLTKDEGAQTTMKFLKEFSMSMGEIEDLFVGLHTSVKTTGLSTTAYLNLLDGITSQFDKMNKSLHFATGLISTLGKNARFTAEDIASMAKGLMGDRKDLTHGTFAYQVMGAKEREDVIQVHEKRAAATREEVLGGGFSADANDEVLRRESKGKGIGISSMIERYIKERQTAQDFRATGGDALRMGAVGELHNTPMAQMAQNIALFRKSMEASGSKTKMIDFMKGGANVSDLASNPAFAAIAKAINIKPEELVDKMGPALSQYAEDVRGAMTNDTTRKKLGLSKEDIAVLRQQTAGGKDITDTDKFAEMLQSSTALTKIFEKGTKEQVDEARKNAKIMAEANRAILTGPLDYIKAMLKAILDNIIDIVAGIMAMLSSALFSMTKGAQDLMRKKNGDSWNAGFVNNGDTWKGVNAGESSFEDAVKGGKVGGAPSNTAKVRESIKLTKELYGAASESGDQNTIRDARGYMQRVIALQKNPSMGISDPVLLNPTGIKQALEQAKQRKAEFQLIKAGKNSEDMAGIAPGNRMGVPGLVDPLRGSGTAKDGFGMREQPVGKNKGKPMFHTGTDEATPVGTDVYADASGVISIPDSSTVVITSDDGNTQYKYRHLSKILKNSGERVSPNDIIALTGEGVVGTDSTGPHLHTEVLRKQADGTWGYVDPKNPSGPAYTKDGTQIGAPQVPTTPAPTPPPATPTTSPASTAAPNAPPAAPPAAPPGSLQGLMNPPRRVSEIHYTNPVFLQMGSGGTALQPCNKSGEA